MTVKIDDNVVNRFGRITRKSYIPVGREIITNKYYLVSAKVFIDNSCRNIDGNRIISKSRFDSILMKVLKLRRYKARKVLDAYLESGVISEYDNDNWIVNFVKPFVVLDHGTAEYCLNNLSDTGFKVYCYLKTAYSYHMNKYPNSPLTFSVSGKSGLLERCGYCGESGPNRKMMNEVLKTLGDAGLIDVSNPIPARGSDGNYRGRYRTLNAVIGRAAPLARVELKNYEDDHKYSDYYDYTPSPMYVDGRKCIYDKAAFDDPATLSSLLDDDRNYNALNDGLNFQDVPEGSIDIVESAMRKWTNLDIGE